MQQSTALATKDRHAALAAFGSASDRQNILPVLAEAINIPAADADAPHNKGVLLKAIAWMQQYGAVAGVHFECIKRYDSRERRDTYPLIAKHEWSILNLAEHNKANRTQYQVIYREATPEEMKELYAAMSQAWDEYRYDPNDVGVWAALVDFKLGVQTIKEMMQMEKELGITTFQWHFGCYRNQVYNSYNKQWKKETLPQTDTPARAAQRRAAHKAINALIPKYPIISREDHRYAYALSTMQGNYDEAHRTPHPSETMGVYRPQVVMDDDGFIIDAPAPAVKPEPAQQHTSTPAQDEDAGEIPFTDPLDLLQLDDITPLFSQWLCDLRKTEGQEGVKPMTEKAYVSLRKVVATLVGGEKWETVDTDDLLSAILNKTICIEALPNHLAGNAIFSAIMTERAARDEQGGFKKVDGRAVYETNPEYNKHIVTGFQWAYEKVKPLEF